MKKIKEFNTVKKNIKNIFDTKGKSKSRLIKLHEPSFSHEEVNAAIKCLISTNVTMGPINKNFEKKYASKFNYKYCLTTNSGSSANLLALSAICNPEYQNKLIPGDEVIVPALSWSTTVWPLVQMGLVPVLVDIDIDTLNIDPQKIKKAISKKTKAVMIVHVYGNPCPMDQIMKICKQNNLLLIEDSCESMGATFKNKSVGSFGEVGTFSFYFSHHITTLEGGCVVTKDKNLNELMTILRAHGWIRELENKKKYIQKYKGIDKKFLFVNSGYNLRITDVQASIGIEQLKKFNQFYKTRSRNAKKLQKHINNIEFLSYQKQTQNGISSNFGFPLIIKKGYKVKLDKLRNFLLKKNIETRPIICGNIAKQPAMKLFKHRVHGKLENSTYVMNNGLAIPNHQNIKDECINRMKEALSVFFK